MIRTLVTEATRVNIESITTNTGKDVATAINDPVTNPVSERTRFVYAKGTPGINSVLYEVPEGKRLVITSLQGDSITASGGFNRFCLKRSEDSGAEAFAISQLSANSTSARISLVGSTLLTPIVIAHPEKIYLYIESGIWKDVQLMIVGYLESL
jgi:hypothetical protein